MSTEIENNIVQMTFDNEKFEKNVKQSLNTIDELKSNLNFDKVSGSFNSITDAAKKVNFSSLNDNVEMTKRSMLDWVTIVENALAIKLSRSIDAVTEKFKNMVTAFTSDQVGAGFQKYSDYTTSVATLVAQGNEALGFEESASTIREVENIMEELNWFTDETSYAFTDMVSNISKFTASGQDLRSSVTAMEGIAEWAALSGQNAATASRAMYQLSQAMSAGYMQKLDWRSIQNANMDTAEFRQIVLDTAEAMGKLESQVNESGEKIYTSLVGAVDPFTKGQFVESLTQGKWFDAEVMMSVYSKYAGAVGKIKGIVDSTGMLTSEVLRGLKDESSDIFEQYGSMFDAFEIKAFAAAQQARTFTDAVDATKDAVSSKWLGIFKDIIGDADQATELWTDLAESWWDIFAGALDTKKQVLDVWTSMDILGVTGRDTIVESFWNIYNAITGVFGAIMDGFRQVFPFMEQGETWEDQIQATARKLYDITKRIQEFTEKLKPSEETLAKIQNVSAGIFSILKFGINLILDVGSALSPLLRFLPRIGGFLLNIGSRISDVLQKASDVSILTKAFEGLENVISKIVNFVLGIDISKIAASLLNFFKRLWTGFKDFVSKIGEGLIKIKNKISDIVSWIGTADQPVVATVKNVFISISDIVSWIGTALQPVVATVKNVFISIAEGIVEAIHYLASLDWILIVLELELIVDNIIKALLAISVSKLTRSLSNFFNKIAKDGVLPNLKTITDGIGTVIDAFAKNLIAQTKAMERDNVANTLLKLAAAIGILALSLVLFTRYLDQDKLLTSGAALASLVATVLGAFAAVNAITNRIGDTTDTLITIGKEGIRLNKSTTPYIKMGIALLAFAGALAIISDAMTDIGKLDNEGFAKGLIGVLSMIYMVQLAMTNISTNILSGDGVTGKRLLATAAMLVTLGASLSILTNAVQKLGAMQMTDFLQGMAGVILLLAGLRLAFSKLNLTDARLSASLASIYVIARTMSKLVTVVKDLGELDILSLVKGLAGMGILISSLSTLLTSIGTMSPGLGAALEIIALGAALYIIAGAVKKMSGIDLWGLAKGILGLVAVLGSLALFLTFTDTLNQSSLIDLGKGMLIMGAGLMVFAVALRAMGSMNLGELLVGLVSLAGILVIIGSAGALFGAFAKNAELLGVSMIVIGAGMAAIGAGLIVLSLGITALGTAITIGGGAVALGLLGLIEMLPTFIAALAEVVSSTAGTIAKMLMDMLLAVLKEIQNRLPQILETVMAVVIGVLTALADNIPTIIEKVGQILLGVIEGLIAFVPQLAEDIMILAAEIVKAFVAGIEEIGVENILAAIAVSAALAVLFTELIVVSGLGIALCALLKPLGKQLSSFGYEILPFLTILNAFDTSVFENAKSLARTLLTLTEASLVQAISTFLTGGHGPDYTKFGKALVEFAPYINEFGNQIKDINSAQVMAASNMAMMLVSLANNLPQTEGLIGWLSGRQDLATFGSQLGAFGAGMKAFGESVSGLSEYGTDIAYASQVGSQLATLANSIPAWGGLMDFLFGTRNLSLFGAQIAAFGSGLHLYGEAVNGLSEYSTDIEYSVTAGESLVNLANSIPAMGGLMDFIFGSNDLGLFGINLALFGVGLKSYGESVQDLNTSDIILSTVAAGSLVRLAETVPSMGGLVTFLTGSNDMGLFGIQLISFGAGLKSFGEAVKDLNISAISDAADVSVTLALFAKTMPNMGGLQSVVNGNIDITGFARTLGELGEGIADFGTALNSTTIDIPKIQNATSAGVEIAKMAKEIPEFKRFLGFGKSDVDSFTESLPGLAIAISDYFTNLSPAFYNDTAVDKIKNSASAAESVVEVVKNITDGGNIFEALTAITDMQAFSKNLSTFGLALNGYSATVTNIDSDKISETAKAASALVEMTNNIPTTGFFHELFNGKKDLAGFGENLKSFGSGLYGFFINTYNMDVDKASDIADVAAKLSDAVSVFFSEDFFEALLSNASFSLFTENLSEFGMAIKKYANAVSGGGDLSTDAVDDSIEIAKKLVELRGVFGTDNIIEWISSLTGMSTFTDNIDELGKGIVIFANNVNDVGKWVNVAFAIQQLQALANLAVTLKDGDVYSIENLAAVMSTTAYTGIDEFVRAFQDAETTATNAVKNFINIFVNGFKSFGESDFNAIGRNILTGIKNGLVNQRLVVENQAKTVYNVILSSLKVQNNDFYNIGWNMMEGLKSGINDRKQSVYSAITTVAKTMSSTMRSDLEINSPSKVFARIGDSVGEGTALGIDRSSYRIYDSIDDVSSSSLSAMRQAFSNITNFVDTNIDSSPVITPVLDMSNLETGSSRIGSMFSGFNVRAGIANAARTSGSMDDARSAAEIQNGAVDPAKTAEFTIHNYTTLDGKVISQKVNRILGVSY